MTKFIQNVALEDAHKERLEFSARLGEVLHEYRNKFCYFAHRAPFLLARSPEAMESSQGKHIAQTVKQMDTLLQDLRGYNRSEEHGFDDLKAQAEATYRELETLLEQLLIEYPHFVRNYADPANIKPEDRHYAFIAKTYEEAQSKTVEHYMDQVRNDFLLLLRGEITHDTLTDFNPRDALNDAINVGLFRLFKVPVQITEAGPAKFMQVHANKGRLSQIFYNLLKNALDSLIERYGVSSETHGQVAIRLDYRQDRVLIEITDNGVGIKAESLPRLFERGFTTKGERGNGIGLAYSHELLSSWGGNLEASSIPLKYTTFKITLPATLG